MLQAEAYVRKRKQQELEQSEVAAKRSAREQQRKQAKLSFLDDEDEDDEGNAGGSVGLCAHRDGSAPPRLTKNSDVPTGILFQCWMYPGEESSPSVYI